MEMSTISGIIFAWATMATITWAVIRGGTIKQKEIEENGE